MQLAAYAGRSWSTSWSTSVATLPAVATPSRPSPARPTRRQRGSIREHRGSFQVRVTAGTDASTGERVVLCETHPDIQAAEKARTRLLADADSLAGERHLLPTESY
jgi:hypothetical protein